MKRFGFFLSILGLFISLSVFAMEQEPPITRVVQVAREQVSHQLIDLGGAPMASILGDQSPKFSGLSSEMFAFDKFVTSDPQPLFEQRPKISSESLGRFSFADLGVGLRDFSGAAPPLDLPVLSIVPKPPKPIIRAGMVLPKVDLAHLGISDFFGKKGISFGKYDFLVKQFKLGQLPELVTTRQWPKLDLSWHLPEFKMSLLLDVSLSATETPDQKENSDLTDEEIISLFKQLTNRARFDEESIIKLEKLLQDARARRVILEASKGPEDHISKALTAAAGILGNSRKLKILIAAEGFLDHLVGPHTVDEEIISLFKQLTYQAVFFSNSDEEFMIMLEKLLQDARARRVILEASKGAEDHISKALTAAAGILGNSRKLKMLIAAEGFLDHLVGPHTVDEEIISLFKQLTYRALYSSNSDEEFMIMLEKLLQDARARRVILEASKGAEDHISKALTAAAGILGNSRKLKMLIAAEGFLDHLLSQPADEKGETLFSKALLDATFFNRLEDLTVFFENQRIWEHLSSIPDAQYQSVVMKALIMAVAFDRDEIIPAFYESRIIFDHLVSCSSRGDADAQDISKAYTRAGLLIALSERTEEKIGRLLHEGVMRALQEDPDLINKAMKKAIEDRNPHLARKLLADLKAFLSPSQVKEAIQVPEIWEALDDKEQQTLLTIAQSTDSYLTEEGLIQQHKQTRAYEHAIVGHPSVVDDMEVFKFKRHAEYRALLTQELDPREREAQKKAIEREFLNVLSAKTAPWFHAETEFAYKRRMFGQGVRGLVVELEVLPEHQRGGLLHPHLDERTVYEANNP